MRTLLALTTLALLAACSSDTGTAPDVLEPSTITLHAPAPDVRIAQNVATLECEPHPTRGYGLRIAFSWSPPTGGAAPIAYFLLVKREGSEFPLFENFVPSAAFTMTGCNAFVIDANLEGWLWQVSPVGPDGVVGPPSEARSFAFLPCRLDDGRACYAPPSS